MRYLKWILVLLIIILVVLEVIYNFSAMSQSFILGFGLAIILEIYFWYKYTMTIRKQNKIIKNLEQKLKVLEEKTETTQLAPTQPEKEASTESV